MVKFPHEYLKPRFQPSQVGGEISPGFLGLPSTVCMCHLGFPLLPVLLRSKAVNFLILHWLITCPPLITSPEGFLPIWILLGIPQMVAQTHTNVVSKTLTTWCYPGYVHLEWGGGKIVCSQILCIYTSLHRSVS